MMPALFVAHGSPMVAIEDTAYGTFLDGLAATLPVPKAIVVFSAHWVHPVQQVSQVDHYSTIYDFGGFPDALYRIQYPATGDAALSAKIVQMLASHGIACEVEVERGLDHGAWTILHRLYPKASIPVVAMSVNPELTPAEQYAVGKALAGLRTEDVLVIGSGVTVHNFGLLRYCGNPEVEAMVTAFEDWLEENLQSWNLDALFDYGTLAPHAQIAVPRGGEEHFVPLFYALGMADESRKASTLHRSLMWGVMTESVYRFD